MREFNFQYEGLRKGLKPFRLANRQEQYLTSCLNLRPAEDRLVEIEPLYNPIPDEAVAFPFPQLVETRDYLLLLGRDYIATIDGNWDFLVELVVESSETWSVVDYGPFIILANGKDVVVTDPDTGDFLEATPSLNGLFHLGKTYCDLNGQLFSGGLLELGLDIVAWSKIGSVDFSIDDSNTAGFDRVPMEDTVVRLEKLGNSVIAFGLRSITAFIPQSLYMQKRVISDVVGVANGNAVDGPDNLKIFLSGDGKLWSLDQDLFLKFIGHRESMLGLFTADTAIVYRKKWEEFYISDGTISYMLSQYGMCRVYQAPTAISEIGDVSYAIFRNVEDTGFELRTDVIDFGLNGLKTLNSVEVVGNFSTAIYISTDWRNNKAEPFKSTRWVLATPEGIATLNVTASEFRVKVQGASYLHSGVERMFFRYKISDKRNVRGSLNVG